MKKINRLLHRLEIVYEIKSNLSIPVSAGRARIRKNNKPPKLEQSS